jgi:predicted RNA methylase
MINGDPTTILNGFFENLLNIGAGVGVFAAACALMFGAFTYMASGGDPMQARAGKNAMLKAVGGLVLVLLAYVIAQMIRSAIAG